MYEADIQRAVDEYVEMQRKAATLDEIVRYLADYRGDGKIVPTALLDWIEREVHPAQEPSKR